MIVSSSSGTLAALAYIIETRAIWPCGSMGIALRISVQVFNGQFSENMPAAKDYAMTLKTRLPLALSAAPNGFPGLAASRHTLCNLGPP